MKLLYLFVCLHLAYVMFAVSGCGSGANLRKNGSFQAEVLKTILLPDYRDPGTLPQFELGVGSFHSLKDLNHLSGDYFELLRGGELKIRMVDGSIVESSGFVAGSAPVPRFHVHNDVVIPDDQDSLLMLSSYFQFDQIAHVLRQATGIAMDEIVANKGKIKIRFYPTVNQIISSSSSTTSIKTTQMMNAAFVPGEYQFLIMPSGPIEDIPLGGNLQVIAHEFGHLIFEYLLASEDDQNQIFLSQYALHGLNEGFADFFSYIITGSSNIIGGSLGLFKDKSAQRNFSRVKFNLETMETESKVQFSFRHADQDLVCNNDLYCVGTIFAKALLNAMRNSSYASNTAANRYAFSQQVVEALKNTKVKLDYDPFVAHLKKATSNEVGKASLSEPLGRFFRAFVSSFKDTNLKKCVRDSLIQEFGSTGFPDHFR